MLSLHKSKAGDAFVSRHYRGCDISRTCFGTSSLKVMADSFRERRYLCDGIWEVREFAEEQVYNCVSSVYEACAYLLP